MKETLQNLDKDVKDMTGAIRDLSDKLTATQILARRLWMVVFATILLGLAFGWYVYDQQNEAAEDRVAQCMNQNEIRQAVLDGWYFILGYELADKSEHQAPAETDMAEAILPYFDKVYRIHDCNNLQKHYPMPTVPEIPNQTNDKALPATGK